MPDPWLHSRAAEPVEEAIALSIVFVAAEIVRGPAGRPGLTERWPWIVAFVFGLLHGLGSASALREVGLPENATPASLLCFNLGLELGQLAFVGVVLALLASLRPVELSGPAWSQRLAPYAVGAVAIYSPSIAWSRSRRERSERHVRAPGTRRRHRGWMEDTND